MSASSRATSNANSRARAITVAGLALFAMFFGAGNLIFPVMLGTEAGTNVFPALAGFLGTGVLLPVLAIIAASSSKDGTPREVAERIGKIPGTVLLFAMFLTTGMFYAVPRVSAVSYEMAIAPLVPGADSGGGIGLAIYSFVFFTVVYLLVSRPSRVVERVGGYLTPALLILMAILVITVVIKLPPAGNPPAPKYVDSPVSTGLLQGYFTMDAIAGFVFGLIIVTNLRNTGFATQRSSFRATSAASLVAGVFLAVVYIGLAMIGTRVAGDGYANGAEALSGVAQQFYGTGGQVLFGAIAILACLTTATGLLTSSTAFFRSYFPSISYNTMLVGQLLIAFGFSNMGLEAILNLIEPVNQLVYPVVITLVVTTLVDILIPGRLYWTYRISAWVAAFVSLFEALWATKLEIFAGLRPLLDAMPLGTNHLPFAVPAVIAFVCGFAIDIAQGRLRHALAQPNLSGNTGGTAK
ncbi:branched-chain amino acid transport system II carrier protein [Actinobaculum suis]|uniref:branched-chain amino acid transport system II carrier protein n=1 Tax=Actinobaculum suis TaxID=1657 RepID=UPI001FD12B2F|nr:branched-chain amino acid transport system II carrier protein [Actinobaculum suis]